MKENAPPPETFQDPPFWTHTTWLQIGYGVWVNLSVVGIGLAFGFPAVSLPQLLDPESPIEVTLKDQAWLASILTLFSPLGCLISGYLQDHYGRRRVLIVAQLPVFIGWIYTGLSTTTNDLIYGRIITGFGVGLVMSVPRTYLTEITLPNMRGVIGTFPSFSVSLGILIQSTLGAFLKWSTLCFICGACSITLLLSYIMIPESPHYVLMKMTAEDAKKVLKKFRSKTFNIDLEVRELAEFKESNNIHRLKFRQQIVEIFKLSSCKPFSIGIYYFTLMQIVGVNVITMWGVQMLKDCNSSVNPNYGNIVLSTTRSVFGLITSILLFKVKRRVMALLSGIGLGVTCVTLATWLYFSGKKSVYPLILLTAYMMFASLGYYALPALIMYELLPLQVRGVLGGAGLAYVNFIMFAVNCCYPYLRETIGLTFVILTFGIISLLGTIVLYYILPETKGMTLQEIEEYFNKTRPTLVSSRQYMLAAQAGPSSSQMTHESTYDDKKVRYKDKKLRFKKDHPHQHSSLRFKDESTDEKDSEEDKKNESTDKKESEEDKKNESSDKKHSEDKKNKSINKKDSDEDQKNVSTDKKHSEEDKKNESTYKKDSEEDQ